MKVKHDDYRNDKYDVYIHGPAETQRAGPSRMDKEHRTINIRDEGRQKRTLKSTQMKIANKGLEGIEHDKGRQKAIQL